MRTRISFLTLTKYFSYLAVIGVVFIMIIGVIDVVGSKFFGWGFPETVVLTELIHVIAVTAPLAYVTLAEGHIDIDLIEEKLPSRARLICRVFANFLGAMFGLFIAGNGFLGFVKAIAEGSSSGALYRLKIWPSYFFLTLAFFLVAISFIIKLWREIQPPYDVNSKRQ